MTTTITLSDENTAGLAWAVELTGLSYEEIVNLSLKDEIDEFQPDSPDSYPQEWIGCWKFRDRQKAEQTLEWVKKRARHDSRGKYPIIETAIRELEDGRFEIHAFSTWKDGKTRRVC
jgi:hypothetical protein